MTRTRPISQLIDPIMADPERRASVYEHKRVAETALALGRLRDNCEVTQQKLAEALNVSQSNVSRIEHEGDVYLSTLRNYVEALGGELEINAVFPDRTVTLVPGEK